MNHFYYKTYCKKNGTESVIMNRKLYNGLKLLRIHNLTAGYVDCLLQGHLKISQDGSL